MRLAVLILVAAALAGCQEAAKPADVMVTHSPPVVSTPNDVPPPPLPRFRASLVDAERPGHEPSVAVAADGTIFVHARGVQHGFAEGDPDSANYLWRSRDGGATFERTGTAAMEALPASEGTVAVLPDGRVLAAYSMMPRQAGLPEDTLQRAIQVFASDDLGDTWDLASEILLPSTHRTWLWPTPDAVHLGALSYGPTFHWTSTDGGQTWSRPDRVYDYNTYNGRMVASGATVLWPWFTGVYEQAPDDAEAAWRLDAWILASGAWTPYPIAELAGGRGSVFAGATVDEAGTFYVAWASWTDAGSQVSYSWSPDGATWHGPFDVAAGPGLRVMPWIESPRAGSLGVVWVQNDAFSGDPLAAEGPWFAEYALVTDAASDAPAVASTRVLPEPILDGAVCLQAFSCGDVIRDGVCFDQAPPFKCDDLAHVRRYDDFLGLDFTPDGRAVMGFVATHGFGLPPWTPGDPGHVLVVVET